MLVGGKTVIPRKHVHLPHGFDAGEESQHPEGPEAAEDAAERACVCRGSGEGSVSTD